MYIHLQSGQHFPASYVSLPECKLVFGPKKIPPQGIMGKSREISWTFFEPCPPRPRWLFFFFTRWAPTDTSYPFQRPVFLGQISRFYRTLGGVVGCKCKAHPLILCQGALRVLCCVHQADFFGDVEYGQFVIFASIVLENIYMTTFPLLAQINHQKKNLMKNPSLLFQNWKKTPSFSAENGSSKRPGPKAWRFPGFFCFRPHFPSSDSHEVFHVDALHVHLWRIKLDGSYRSIDEYWCLCCLMMAGWVRGFQP